MGFTIEIRCDCDRLKRVEDLLHRVVTTQENIMATLADLQAKVAAEDTVIQSVITLLGDLSARIAALEPNQAAIDALAADIDAETQALAAAVTANTPTP